MDRQPVRVHGRGLLSRIQRAERGNSTVRNPAEPAECVRRRAHTLYSASGLASDLRALGEHERARELDDWIRAQREQ